MKRLLFAVLLGSQFMTAQVGIGIRIGAPPRPRVERAHAAAPGPGYNWIDGYWFADGGRWRWHDGYWTRPPYAGARWVTPRYEGDQFYNGAWEGDRGRMEHDHRWDKNHQERDYRPDHDRR